MKADCLRTFERVFSETYQIRENVRQGNISGLIIGGQVLFPEISDEALNKSHLTVKVLGSNPSRTDYLLNRVPLPILAEISQYYFGESSNKNNIGVNLIHSVKFLSSQVKALGGDLTNFEKFFGNICLAGSETEIAGIMVPLGFLHLGADRELEVTLELAGDADLAGSKVVSLMTYTDTAKSDFMLEYDLTKDLERNISMVNSMWMYREDLANLVVADGSDEFCHLTKVQYRVDDEVSREVSLYEAMQLTNIVGRVEMSSIRRAALIMEKQSDVPSEGFVEVNGLEDLYKMLVIRERYDNKSVSKNTVLELEKEAKKIEKIEQDSPQTAEAMRHAGIIPKSKSVRKTVEVAKEQNLDTVSTAA